MLGVTTQTVLKFEKGYVTPNADILNKMIEFLDCNDPGWFLTGKSSLSGNPGITGPTINSYSTEEQEEFQVLMSRVMAVIGADDGLRKVLMKMADADLTMLEEMLAMRRVLSMKREYADRPR